MPVVADRIREDVSVAVERRGRDGSPGLGVALETMFGIFVPEVKGTVGASSTKCTVDGMKGDGVNGVDIRAVTLVGNVLAMTFKGKIGAGVEVCQSGKILMTARAMRAYLWSFSSTY